MAKGIRAVDEAEEYVRKHLSCGNNLYLNKALN